MMPRTIHSLSSFPTQSYTKVSSKHPYPSQKQNSTPLNLPCYSNLHPSYSNTAHLAQKLQKHHQSTSSNGHTTVPKASTDNLHFHRLESTVLQLQKQYDQQHYQIQILTEESSYYMKMCEQQKQIIISMNVQGMRQEFQQQIAEMLNEKNKVQQIIGQLQDDYNQVYLKEESDLQMLRNNNTGITNKIDMEIQRKACIISMLAQKCKEDFQLDVDCREAEEKLDELRNVERKLNIALRELQALKAQDGDIGSGRHQRINSKASPYGRKVTAFVQDYEAEEQN